MNKKRWLGVILVLLLFVMTACGGKGSPVSDTTAPSNTEATGTTAEKTEDAQTMDTTAGETEGTGQPDTSAAEDLPAYGACYYDLVHVVLYLDTYGELPPNYITKEEARALGWEGGSVEAYREGAAIGGDTFGNREGLLPKKDGRRYTECDIDTDGYGSRGSRRLVFSNDGLYFYTADHYETFQEVTVTREHEVIW